ncbi:HsdM family class I SAM-dependent methyltransferase [Chryseobacterium aureum]|uniref:HsdM family class I SAM-dependent methyltransferase n=1 Tax=Chryseobacterium aureum TaxID=2497456 RepID=UPI000F8954DB|nr:N-6 DNA methylase [Chryseobacterium aureum]
MSVNILQYESDIWKTADYLRGAGIKESDFPKYMMPFFALLMVESRLIRESGRLENELSKEDINDFVEIFQLEGLGYNDYVIRQNKTLKTISQNDKNFNLDFQLYLQAFDGETKSLLGVERGTDEEKYLDISGISSLLNKKRILFDYVKTWSEIDLTPFSNSEITTLEEHIKRRWADISAETSGEQYTPDDIISLISDIIVTKIEDNGKFLTIYDPTCGGGNLLFGVEDRIRETFRNRPTATFGEDWNDALYALAKIESRFRTDSTIRHGNTLTEIKFIEKRFDVVVANPPYGVDWKGYQKDIQNDKTERFVALPSISDGQFLFTQHILYQLADDGISIVVHNGSTLFSGDAGSGESNIRKYFFDQDWVEGIIQMPTDEFFNTGIYTYLWIFNKNKPAERKNKVILINASDLCEPLKKSRGKKRKQMNFENRKDILKAFNDFSNNNFAKVFDKWEFYYNKQSIMLTNADENGRSIEMPLKANRSGEMVEEKSIKLNPVKIQWLANDEMQSWTEFEISEFDKQNYNSLEKYFENEVKPLLSGIDYKENRLKFHADDVIYYFDNDKETIIEDRNGSLIELGCGKLVIKPILKKATKTKDAIISISLELTKDLQKDYEIISYTPEENENQKGIDIFMAKYVTRPFEYIDNIVGVEINFNKVFYQPEQLRELTEITKDLKTLEAELSNLEKELEI